MIGKRAMGRDGATLRVRDRDGSSLLAGPLGGADPLGFAAGDANLYRYVGNDLTGMVDPSGLSPTSFVGISTAVLIASLPDKRTVVAMSTEIVSQVNKQKTYPMVTLPGTGQPLSGPCAAFAKLMAEALTAKNMNVRLRLYRIAPGRYFYTFPNGVKVLVEVGNGEHVIVQVLVKNGGSVETISLDAGITPAGAMSLGNLGANTTGVIAPRNRNPTNLDTGKPVLTEFPPAPPK